MLNMIATETAANTAAAIAGATGNASKDTGMIIAWIPVVVVKVHGNSVLYVIRVAMVPGDRVIC